MCELAYIKKKTLAFSSLAEAPPGMKTEGLTQLGFHAYLGIPIIIRGETLGTICTFSYGENVDVEKNITLLQAVAQQVGVAIENANLFKETQERSAEMILINRVITQLSSSLDLTASLQIVTDELGRGLSLASSSIALLNSSRTELTIIADYAQSDETRSRVGAVLPLAGNLSFQRVIER